MTAECATKLIVSLEGDSRFDRNTSEGWSAVISLSPTSQPRVPTATARTLLAGRECPFDVAVLVQHGGLHPQAMTQRAGQRTYRTDSSVSSNGWLLYRELILLCRCYEKVGEQNGLKL